MKTWISSGHPERFFLLDAFGALLSAFLLGVVLVHYAPAIGLPVPVLRNLAAIDCFLLAYDLLVYFLRLKPWPLYLRGIATLNLLYAALTLGLMIVHRSQLSLLGVGYFVGELLIVVALALAELQFAAKAGNTS